jgi:hypothetical protein
MGKLSSALLALGCCWLTSADAQQAEPEAPSPDLDFLEYLGAWAEEDDEWLAIEEWEKGQPAQPDSDTPGSEQEKDDDDEGE